MATATAGQTQRARVTAPAASQRRFLGLFVSVVVSCGVGATLLGPSQHPQSIWASLGARLAKCAKAAYPPARKRGFQAEKVRRSAWAVWHARSTSPVAS